MKENQIKFINELVKTFREAKTESGLITMTPELRDYIVIQLEDIVKPFNKMINDGCLKI